MHGKVDRMSIQYTRKSAKEQSVQVEVLRAPLCALSLSSTLTHVRCTTTQYNVPSLWLQPEATLLCGQPTCSNEPEPDDDLDHLMQSFRLGCVAAISVLYLSDMAWKLQRIKSRMVLSAEDDRYPCQDAHNLSAQVLCESSILRRPIVCYLAGSCRFLAHSSRCRRVYTSSMGQSGRSNGARSCWTIDDRHPGVRTWTYSPTEPSADKRLPDVFRLFVVQIKGLLPLIKLPPFADHHVPQAPPPRKLLPLFVRPAQLSSPHLRLLFRMRKINLHSWVCSCQTNVFVVPLKVRLIRRHVSLFGLADYLSSSSPPPEPEDTMHSGSLKAGTLSLPPVLIRCCSP